MKKVETKSVEVGNRTHHRIQIGRIGAIIQWLSLGVSFVSYILYVTCLFHVNMQCKSKRHEFLLS